MRTRQIGLTVALLGLLIGVVTAVQQFLPVVAHRSAVSLGEMAIGLSAISFLLAPVFLFLTGYWAAGRADIPAEYTSFAALFGLVGGGAALVGFVPAAIAIIPSGSFELTLVWSALYNVVVRGIDFAITGLAGGAVRHFSGR
ncbi:hypothetical protein E6P09_14315 [Haloferax mediterranei ATCC 33500]|uniref:Uncharacterized protein n=1 Tax=Haloferax mediterranei (strain ATCC 33500 / DSM 1411 / JCM 8866 / NBRC 14739 / NCIMB 2177 / R-4) TaxID=523841 RepID=M0ISL6_HALMT|nr:hypothetical protein [Haloferax mediterranei]AHZ23550.1 hypothetical protein BM92_13265 [Haloferax mediterranei ATCC 33500]ELZ99725.1 hypothetical protein C439_14264 [Haloferax mediterranei ATCC 33500]MDX5987071.1 hypothetical protein [Haloferax mediterranei ATCC 33500]QCQ76386.1 hypothetical protein E6P09_14315 [Haloferax mediterranei ATCC 33500]